MREIVAKVLSVVVSKECYSFYIGQTVAPLWRFYGCKGHKMVPHADQFDCMEVLTAYTPSYCETAEKFVIKHELRTFHFKCRLINCAARSFWTFSNCVTQFNGYLTFALPVMNYRIR